MNKTKLENSWIARLKGKVAIVGAGNMGSVLIRAMLNNLKLDPQRVIACDRSEAKLKQLAEEYSIGVVQDVGESVKEAGLIIIAVKPKDMTEALVGLSQGISEAQHKPWVISVAAGVKLEKIKSALPPGVAVVRVMPNLPCIIGKGMVGIYAEKESDALLADGIFTAVGKTLIVQEESQLDVVTAVAASGPAFIFVLIEALADGAVKMGVPREQALTMATQMVYGAAALVLESGEHPAKLKDLVASPRGTTIAGLHVLEDAAFRATLISAVEASAKRARELGS